MIATKDTELFSERDWMRLKEHMKLPPRQAEILRCVMGGLSDKQIAHATGISVNTVRSHMSRLFGKFGANDRVELILHMFAHLRQYHSQEDLVPAPDAAAPEVMGRAVRKRHQ